MIGMLFENSHSMHLSFFGHRRRGGGPVTREVQGVWMSQSMQWMDQPGLHHFETWSETGRGSGLGYLQGSPPNG